MQRISSNASLFWKIFFPTFWFAFYGILTVALWAYTGEEQSFLLDKGFRWGITIFYVLGSFVIFLTILQIKRVEYEDEKLYVTNYFRTIRIPFELISHISIQNFGVFKRGKIYLHKNTPFGKSIVFMVTVKLIEDLMEEHPEFFD